MIDQSNFQDYFMQNRWVKVFFVFFLSVVLLRVAYLQLWNGNQFFVFSQNNQVRHEYVPALRGLMYDREGRILADHEFRYDVVWVPQYIQNREVTLNFLAQTLDIPPESISKILKRYGNQPKYLPIVVAKNVSEKVVAIIEEQKKFFDGIDLLMTPVRYYPHKEVLAHVLGYVSQVDMTELGSQTSSEFRYRLGDLKGKRGVELVSETHLRGRSGLHYSQVDAHGRRVETSADISALWNRLNNVDPIQGKHLKTTIDLDIQTALYESFENNPGAGVVMDIHSGAILAMVSLPSYDPNTINEHFADIVNQPEYPLFNKAIQGVFPPGSTFKVITAMAGLHMGLVAEDESVSCPGTYRLGRRTYHCWKRHGHGRVALKSAIVESCDVYFYTLGRTIGIDRLSEFSQQLGFGDVLGIELMNERGGLMPTRAWKEKRLKEPWQEGETLSSAIGQGFVGVTPLQLAVSYAALLNGGKVYKPYIIAETQADDNTPMESTTPMVIRDLHFNAAHSGMVREAMIDVMETRSGTGYWRRSKVIKFGGKTGTSQVRQFSSDELFKKCEDLPFDQRHHGLFVGFWPVDDPQIVAAVVREHACHGSSAAIPIVRAALEAAASDIAVEAGATP